MRSRSLVPVTVLLGVVAVTGPERIDAAPADCFGHEPTIVGGRGEARGTSGDDVIVADHTVSIYALGGDDLICVVGDGYHVVTAGPGDDRVAGSPGNDNVWPGAGDDDVYGVDGDDVVDGRASGDDVLVGGPGNDALFLPGVTDRPGGGVRIDLRRGTVAGFGHDRIADFRTISATNGPDVILGDEANSFLVGRAGRDRIAGGGGNDTIIGREKPSGREPDAADRLRGGAGDDRITAGDGRDDVEAGPGDDFLSGGSPGEGRGDEARGGGGRDRCIEFERTVGCERTR